MPPILALFIYAGFIVFLFRRDFREKPNVTGALWIPFFWVVISGSRFISQWLGILGLQIGGGSVEEGNPIDAVFYFALIAGGVYVLYKRRVNYSEFVRNNRWVTIYLAYCLIAIIWSDFPFVALKRWIKLFGQPVMVLILLTEPDPMESLTRLLKRCAYVLVPISILFIKYFPEWGRGFDPWSGIPRNTGITSDKNALGYDCFILGFFFFWHFLKTRQLEKSKARRNELILCGSFLFMIGWLLKMAQSSTSLVSCLIGIAIVLFLGIRVVNKKTVGAYLAIGIIICAMSEAAFGVFSQGGIRLLGKDPTLTGRTEIWHALLQCDVNPVVGTGFESFWLGERREKLWATFPSLFLNQAHNGYLETYLNLGVLGILATAGMIVATYFKARRELLTNFDFGRFRLGYLAAFVIYNWTEAAFRTHEVPFFIFFAIAIDYPAPQFERIGNFSETDEIKADEDLSAAQVEILNRTVG